MLDLIVNLLKKFGWWNNWTRDGANILGVIATLVLGAEVEHGAGAGEEKLAFVESEWKHIVKEPGGIELPSWATMITGKLLAVLVDVILKKGDASD